MDNCKSFMDEMKVFVLLPPIVDEDVVHFEVSRFAGLFVVELDKSILQGEWHDYIYKFYQIMTKITESGHSIYLQGVAGFVVADHLAVHHLAEPEAERFRLIQLNYSLKLFSPGEDDFQIVVRGHGIEFADEQNVFRRRAVGVGQISDHFQNRCLKSRG